MRNSGTEAHIKVVHAFYVRLSPRFPCGAITSHFFSVIFFVFDSLFWPLIIVFHLTSCRNSPTHWTQTFILILVTRDLPPQKMNLSKNKKNVLSTMNIKLWNEWVSCLGDQPRKSFWTKLHDILFSILANKVYNLNTKILTLRWIVVQSNLYWAVLY